MARFARTRTTRWIVSGLVFVIVVVSVVQFRHRGTKPAGGNPVPGPLAGLTPKSPAVDPGPVKPIRTQTPAGPTTRGGVPGGTGTGTAAGPTDSTPPVPRGGEQLSPVLPPATGDVASLLADAKAKAATDPIAARKTLNDALVGGTLSAGDADAVKHELADLNAVLVFSTRQFPDDPLGGVYTVEPGNRLQKIANQYDVTYPLLMDLNGLADASKMQAGQTLKVVKGPFHAVVTKSAFTLDLYLGGPGGPGSTYVTTYPVGLGTKDCTPAGTWLIGKGKTANPRWDLGTEHIKGGDPKNPIGPFWMPLEGLAGQAKGQQHYGIHGTIDPDSIGKMSSLGCIRLRNEDVTEVYKLLISGKSQVVVKD